MKLTERFTATRDKYQWLLNEHTSYIDKNGDEKISTRTTYHPSLKRCCMIVLERDIGNCENIEKVIDKINGFEDNLNKLIPNERDV